MSIDLAVVRRARDGAAARLARRQRLRRLNAVITVLHGGMPDFRYRGDRLPAITSAPRRILFVKLVGLGDAVMVRSLAEQLQRARPDVEIGVLGGRATIEALQALANVVVHEYDPAALDGSVRTGLRVLRSIRRQGYDAVIDFEQHLAAVALFIRATGIPIRIGLAARNNPRWRYQTHTIELTGDERMWDAYTALVRVLEPSLTSPGALPLRCSADTVAQVDAWWTANGLDACKAVVAFHLGSGGRSAARRWQVNRFASLADALVRAHAADAFVLTGTPEERPLVEEFAGLFAGKTVDATGLGSVASTADALRRCRLAISNDTGTMHLAAAMGTPTLGLFGPNTPARYAPIGSATDAVYAPRVACSPCINIHAGVVPECFHSEVGRCMLDLDVSLVTERALALLHRSASEGH